MMRSMRALLLLGLMACGSRDTPQAPEPGPPIAEPPIAEPTIEPPPVGEVPEPVETSRALVKLIVLGEFPSELEAAVAAGLAAELQVEVETIDGVELPQEAYYPRRRRYRADRLLEFLNEHLAGEPERTRVLGLTSVDISTTKPPHEDWGVFGLGELGGRSSVISIFRLRRRARDAEHLEFRIVTTAIHEIGHTLGLDHCVEPGCVMRDAEGSITTVDTSTGHLGPECRAELDDET
jgi:archaemetzincin